MSLIFLGLILLLWRVLWCGSVQVEIRPMMYVALTYDHRLIDGREAVTFLRKIKSVVEDPRVLLLDMWALSDRSPNTFSSPTEQTPSLHQARTRQDRYWLASCWVFIMYTSAGFALYYGGTRSCHCMSKTCPVRLLEELIVIYSIWYI